MKPFPPAACVQRRLAHRSPLISTCYFYGLFHALSQVQSFLSETLECIRWLRLIIKPTGGLKAQQLWGKERVKERIFSYLRYPCCSICYCCFRNFPCCESMIVPRKLRIDLLYVLRWQIKHQQPLRWSALLNTVSKEIYHTQPGEMSKK